MEGDSDARRKETRRSDQQSEGRSHLGQIPVAATAATAATAPTTPTDDEIGVEHAKTNQSSINDNKSDISENHDDEHENRSSPLSLNTHTPGDHEEDELDLSTFDILSHTQSTYNDSHSIIYTQHSALDLFYDTNFESTVRMRESIYNNTLTESGANALAEQFDRVKERMAAHGILPGSPLPLTTATAKQPHSWYTHSQTPPPYPALNEQTHGNHDHHSVSAKDGIQNGSSHKKHEVGSTSLSSSPPPSHHQHHHHHSNVSPVEHSLPSQWLVMNASGDPNALNLLNSQLSSHLSKHSSTFHHSAETSESPTPVTSTTHSMKENPEPARQQQAEAEFGFGLRSEICMAENDLIMMDLPTEGHVDIPVPSEYSSIPAANFFSNQKVAGFTVLQAIQFLLENSMFIYNLILCSI